MQNSTVSGQGALSGQEKEQQRLAINNIINSDQHDPFHFLMLRQLLEDPLGFLSNGLGGSVTISEMRRVNQSSEEGVIYDVAFDIFKEDLKNNQEYQDIETRLNELRDQARLENNNDIFDSPEFEELYQRQLEIQAEIDADSIVKAQERVGITLAEASQEIGSGQHLMAEHATFSVTDIDASYIKAVLDASTDVDRDGNALSSENSEMLNEAQDTLKNAIQELEILHSDPNANPDDLAQAEVAAASAYNDLTDIAYVADVDVDYFAAEDALENVNGGAEPTVFDVLGADVEAQGDQSLMRELQEIGALSVDIVTPDPAVVAPAANLSNQPLQP